MSAMVGLVGGLGPEATIDYYRRILAAWDQRFPGSSPPLVIDNLDAMHVLRLATSDRAALTAYVAESVSRLGAAGAHFAAITSNTTHVVFDGVAARSPIPLISIVETCADEAARLGLTRCLLLGAGLTMEESFYPTAFARRRLEIVIPDRADRAWIHAAYVGQLLKGEFRAGTRAKFIAFVQRFREKERFDAVILGGTELPLLLRTATVADLPVLDTTGIHVAAIVERMG
jgi:aspartate racemase